MNDALLGLSDRIAAAGVSRQPSPMVTSFSSDFLSIAN